MRNWKTADINYSYYFKLFSYILFFKLFIFACFFVNLKRSVYKHYNSNYNNKNIVHSRILSKNNIKIETNSKISSVVGDEINKTIKFGYTKYIPDGLDVNKYVVKRGDNIWDICRKHKISPAELFKINRLDTEIIHKGQILYIPVYYGRTKLPSPSVSFLWPVNGEITSAYGMRIHPKSKRYDFHDAIDIMADKYTPIKAAADGFVIFSGVRKFAGKTIILEHFDGFSTVYAHCNSISFETGDFVTKGDIIARVGKTGYTTGYHLHFAIKLYGASVNPVKYLSEYTE